MLKLSLNTMQVLRARYLLKDDNQNIIETPSGLFRRVAFHIAQAEKRFRSRYRYQEIEEKFFQMMHNLEFMPNSPTLMNAGTSLGQLSACFVLPVQDSMDDIFKSLKDMAIIHQTGGGTGFDFSTLRPKGDLVSSTKGQASGAVSFMSVFDKATDVIVQGGRRRGANMGILRCDHPDVIDFIKAKAKKNAFENFNLSIAVTDKFMKTVATNDRFDLINPRTGKRTGSIKARFLFNLIVKATWQTGDPGLVFLDEINKEHPVRGLGRITATNPCGEVPLLSYESCNLASINLSKMVKKNTIDWQRLKESVEWGIRFLDDVIETNKFPLPEIREMTLKNRKIGLGVMGFADALIKLKIPYTSKKAVLIAGEIMKFIHRESKRASNELAKERGVFPNYKYSTYKRVNFKMRNATVNTIAPTGTISIIAGCSSGIEPLFAISFVRNVLGGAKLFEVNPLFEEAAKERGIFSKELISKIARSGSIQSIRKIPKGLRKTFVTAFDVSPKQHLMIQTAFQRYTDNSVSKTINLPDKATIKDVRNIYMLAYKLKCKGITIYRYGTKKGQVLSFGQKPKEIKGLHDLVTASSEYSGGCAFGPCAF